MKNSIGQLHFRSGLFLITVAIGCFALSCEQKAKESSPPVQPSSPVGVLKIFVPVGVIGDNYWIYLNGHIVSAPPHSTIDPKQGQEGLVRARTKDGWEFWSGRGLELKTRHGQWDVSIMNRYNGVGGYSTMVQWTSDQAVWDPQHIFQVVERRVETGTYAIELVILLSPDSSRSSFPFVINGGYTRDVQSGQTEGVSPGIPDDWSDSPVAIAAATTFCDGSSPPSAAQLNFITEYMQDPIVKSLRAAMSASLLPHAEGVVMLDLPPEQGGSREFDGRQIRHIVDTISGHYYGYTLRDVAACQRNYPQFSRSYAELSEMISAKDKDIESFRKWAAELEGSH